MVKIIATSNNPFHKTGQEITTSEAMAEHLVNKGFAKYPNSQSESAEQPQETEQPKKKNKTK